MNNKKVKITNLSISAKVTRVKKIEIDKLIYEMVSRGEIPYQMLESRGYSWLVKYNNEFREIEDAGNLLDFSGILVQDIDSMTLRVNGEVQKNFVSQIKFHTDFEIYHQNNYSSEYAMIEVSEDRINYEIKINEEYNPEKIGCGISRNLIAENVLVCWMNLTYNNEFICQTRPVETKIIKSYVVNPKGKRILLEDKFNR